MSKARRGEEVRRREKMQQKASHGSDGREHTWTKQTENKQEEARQTDREKTIMQRHPSVGPLLTRVLVVEQF